MEKKKISKKEYIQFSFVMIGIASFFITLIYLISQKRGEEIQEINNDFSITNGVITKISLYKGHHIDVKFKVNNELVTGSDGMQKSTNKNVGDSIQIKYSNKNPTNFITELNNSF
ncbi:hypothetical protein A0O34_08860 [Chryseobacterium glaciei]|uniref:DUF3592 domain-containing protein n=1 Tax=Chryseobacterium glaciei TaxID=1685010 RepID=A0A172XUW8_9FLAO|nr:hypothetical protein [Chryseobacterium glaciei]ANF50625.1 hypothetical protein A0O34_08860 [Chryseobacterium glaciei]